MDREPLSKRQEDILQFISSQVREHGYPPSVREIGNAVGLSSSATVHSHLSKLEQKGYIRRDPTKPRAIEVVSDPSELPISRSISVPLLGRVTAGLPILAVENIEDYFPLPEHFATMGDLFMLTVQGDSMIEAGILDGDLVVVRRQSTANDGDIVVALIGEEATVKAFYKEADHVRLQPRNPKYAPILAREVTVLGRVVALYRFFER
jgi:repressor LexA